MNSHLSELFFETAIKEGYNVVELDTAENNTHAIEVYKHLGFKLVSYKANQGGDHYSVIMVKWLERCPYSNRYCAIMFGLKRIYIRFRYKANKEKRFGI